MKTQFVGCGVSSQSKCSCWWISEPASSCHRSKLSGRNLRDYLIPLFFCVSRNLTKVWKLSLKGERASCPRSHNLRWQTSPKNLVSCPLDHCCSFYIYFYTYCGGTNPTALCFLIWSLDQLFIIPASEDSYRCQVSEDSPSTPQPPWGSDSTLWIPDVELWHHTQLVWVRKLTLLLTFVSQSLEQCQIEESSGEKMFNDSWGFI